MLKHTSLYTAIGLCLLFGSGCKKFMDLPLPVDQIAGSGAYISDASAGGVASGNLSNAYMDGLFTGSDAIPFRAAFYADDLYNLTPGAGSNATAFYQNNIQSANVGQWSILYKELYSLNAAIEGITGSTAQMDNRNQWLGETYFLRAQNFFYLVNLFGDVPMPITSNFQANNGLGRTPQADVYKQIISDLQQAQTLLQADYRDGYGQTTTNRTRPNKGAAAGLLARVYLYTGDWAHAEAEADSVISNTGTYQLETFNNVFIIGTNETIWELAWQTSGGFSVTIPEYAQYNNATPTSLPAGQTPFNSKKVAASLNPELANSFEPGDNRFTNWVQPVTEQAGPANPTTTYYLNVKYKSAVNGVENSVQMRLAEMFLIRAEARAHLNNIGGAQDDINAIRTRAGLGNTTAANQTDLLAAIAKERRLELFCEGAHRFFDLKRTGAIDAVMTVETAEKGGQWASYKQLWPISSSDILVDHNLTQNPGYQQ
jgi:starch-binding outer membrane protein, SusD/RagB family